MQTLSSKEQLFAILQLSSRVVTYAQPIKRESYTWKHPLAGRIKFIFDGCPLGNPGHLGIQDTLLK